MHQPDIEVYVKNASLPDLLGWLGQQFELPADHSDWSTRYEAGKILQVTVKRAAETVPLMITPNAAGKAYTSLWFKSSRTGWQDDLHCARDCAKATQLEVRCSANGWEESEELDSEQWWVVKGDEERKVKWG